MHRAAVFLLVLAATACGSSGTPSASPCTTHHPERVVDSPLDVKDLSQPVPEATLDMNGDAEADVVKVENGTVTVDDLVLTTEQPAGLSIRTWADLDGDGDDDLLVDDGALWVVAGGRFEGRHAAADVGAPVDDRLTTIWPGSLDTDAGADFYVVRETGGHIVTDVYSGKAVLRGAASVHPTHLHGAPRSLARLEPGGPLETVLLDAGPPSTVTFAPHERGRLGAAIGESHRVTWVRVFDEDGTRKIALQIDRKVAVWAVPDRCMLR